MLANDASQLAQQCDFEPARSLSWTHPHRNRASAVIRVSYDFVVPFTPDLALSLLLFSSLCICAYISPFTSHFSRDHTSQPIRYETEREFEIASCSIDEVFYDRKLPIGHPLLFMIVNL